jgi:hypothetical protein
MLEKNISKEELVRFLHAEAGARLVCHAGNLAEDRLADVELGADRPNSLQCRRSRPMPVIAKAGR